MTEITFTVPGMSCDHCQRAVSSELTGVPGVETVDIDLETKVVTVGGSELDDTALRAAIEQAGYHAVA